MNLKSVHKCDVNISPTQPIQIILEGIMTQPRSSQSGRKLNDGHGNHKDNAWHLKCPHLGTTCMASHIKFDKEVGTS
jgi:hypothetical protein